MPAAAGDGGAHIRGVAKKGFVDGDLYERGRLAYDAEAVAQAVADAGVPAGATVLDLAAGTGLLTRRLADHATKVIAVEPQAEMREVLVRAVPGAEVLDGTAEAIPLGDGTVDAVFVGDAFHWFDGPRAVPEIRRVLAPGGVLVVLFRRPGDAGSEWLTEAFEPATRNREAALGKAWGGRDWRESLTETPLFGPLADGARETEVDFDRAAVVDFAASWSFVRALPEPEREALLAEIAERVPDGPLRLPWRTQWWWTR